MEQFQKQTFALTSAMDLFGIWALSIGIYLRFGIWDLKFKKRFLTFERVIPRRGAEMESTSQVDSISLHIKLTTLAKVWNLRKGASHSTPFTLFKGLEPLKG